MVPKVFVLLRLHDSCVLARKASLSLLARSVHKSHSRKSTRIWAHCFFLRIATDTNGPSASGDLWDNPTAWALSADQQSDCPDSKAQKT